MNDDGAQHQLINDNTIGIGYCYVMYFFSATHIYIILTSTSILYNILISSLSAVWLTARPLQRAEIMDAGMRLQRTTFERFNIQVPSSKFDCNTFEMILVDQDVSTFRIGDLKPKFFLNET